MLPAMRRRLLVPLFALAWTAAPAAEVEFSAAEIATVASLSRPVPRSTDPTNAYHQHPAAVRLGAKLFFYQGLSGNGHMSCASCHQGDKAWQDGRPLAQGLAQGRRNTPSLFHAAHQRWYRWDGQVATLWSQSTRPIEDPDEMGGERGQVLCRIWKDRQLAPLYQALFGAPAKHTRQAACARAARPLPLAPSAPPGSSSSRARAPDIDRHFANVGKALAAFVGALPVPATDFDRFAARLVAHGRADARFMPITAQQGLKLFIGKARCIACHHTPLFSDREFHNLLLPLKGKKYASDLGRFAGAQQLAHDPFGPDGAFSDRRDTDKTHYIRHLKRSEQMIGQFRTPSLRQVARTAPYMHNGQFATLREVLVFYSTMEGAQRGGHHDETLMTPLGLTREELDQLEAFLKAL
jgi:cytochrome c peroxidase